MGLWSWRGELFRGAAEEVEGGWSLNDEMKAEWECGCKKHFRAQNMGGVSQ